MDTLKNIIESKIEIFTSYNNKIEELLSNTNSKNTLPKYIGQINEHDIQKYISSLNEAIKKPLLHKRKQQLLKIIDTIPEQYEQILLDNSLIEKTIDKLSNLKNENEILYNYFKTKILENTHKLSSFNSRLSSLNKYANQFNIGDLKSKKLQNYVIKQIDNELENYYEIINQIDAAITIENKLNISIDKIEEVEKLSELLSELSDYSDDFRVKSKTSAINDLTKQLNEYKEKHQKIKKEFNYWVGYLDKFYPLSENLLKATNELKNIKDKIRNDYKSIFKLLTQVYTNNLFVSNKVQFINKLNTICEITIANIELKKQIHIDSILELYDKALELKQLNSPKTKNKFEDLNDLNSFFNETISEFSKLKEKLKTYRSLLQIEEDYEFNNFETLNKSLKNHEETLRNKLGSDYQKIIGSLNNDNEINKLKKDDLIKFLKFLKPIIIEKLEL